MPDTATKGGFAAFVEKKKADRAAVAGKKKAAVKQVARSQIKKGA